MSAIRQSQTTRLTRLSARASPYHPSVTLFEVQPPSGQVEQPEPPEASSSATRVSVGDIEDVVPDVKDEDAGSVTHSQSKSSKRRGTTPRKKKPIQQVLEKPHPAPERWRETYDAIKEMRSQFVAPVDTMGCDQAQFKETEPRNQRFATLVSLMLSSQTKDEVTDAAVSSLRAALGGTLSVDGVIDAAEETISTAISKVGFWRRKTQYLKQAAQKLRDEFDSDVPKTVDELCSLPGVGPKMAFLALHTAWDLNVGIGVDVHVHRITNRLGWHRPPTKTPEETRLNLQSWLPTEFHREINRMLVGFGQSVCLPVGPRCSDCTLSTQKLCPSARQGQTKGGNLRKVMVAEIELEQEGLKPSARR